MYPSTLFIRIRLLFVQILVLHRLVYASYFISFNSTYFVIVTVVNQLYHYNINILSNILH